VQEVAADFLQSASDSLLGGVRTDPKGLTDAPQVLVLEEAQQQRIPFFVFEAGHGLVQHRCDTMPIQIRLRM
jgi:hypothetical protein